MGEDHTLSESLKHPRRSLGNRYRSQAEKFLRLGNDVGNLSWAEQSAKQSILYDFTNEENWRVLIRIKIMMEDSEGARSVLSDLFSVLGRDPELMSQLSEIDIVESCEDLLEGAFLSDPLDSDKWWSGICDEPEELREFSERLRILDVSDQRSNILYSRRLERLRDGGYEDEFLDLSRVLLSQRPTNHESWEQLGMLYERRQNYDEAWLCYDQAQLCFPGNPVRDEFKSRMEDELDGKQRKKWKSPGIEQRVDFLSKMEDMAAPDNEIEVKEDQIAENPMGEVEEMINEGRLSEAFFMTRRMAAQGIEGALEINEELRKKMERE